MGAGGLVRGSGIGRLVQAGWFRWASSGRSIRVGWFGASGARPGCEVRPVSVHLRPGRLVLWAFVAVPGILDGCPGVRVVEGRAILYVCSKVVCFLVSRPVVRPGC